MRILVTGVAGRSDRRCCGARTRRAGTSCPRIAPTLDLTNRVSIAVRLEALRPDMIVNPAAYTAVDRAEDERDLAFVVNGESPGAIARWAADRRVPLIHSTDYAFDGSGTRPWREDDPTGPLSVYGASKLAGEQAMHDAGGARLIVRTSWVYAAQGANFLRTIARLARERDELRIVGDQSARRPAAWIAEATANLRRPAITRLTSAFTSAPTTASTWPHRRNELARLRERNPARPAAAEPAGQSCSPSCRSRVPDYPRSRPRGHETPASTSRG